MIRYDSAHKIAKRLLRQTTHYKKQQGNSLHTHSLRKNAIHSHRSSNLRGQHNLPIIKGRKRIIPIYLLYKDQKFMIKSYEGMQYSQLVSILYKQILNYQININNLNKQECQEQLNNILGFSTVCNNLKIDYLMSILQGNVQKSLLLECFNKKINKTKGKKYNNNYSHTNSTTKINNNNNNNSNNSNSNNNSINNKSYKINTPTSTDMNNTSIISNTKKQNNTNNNNSNKNSNKNKIDKIEGCKFDYQIYNCLAIGGFSKVYLARSYDDGKFYAIKFIKKKAQKQKNELNRIAVINQMQICSQLNHPFLIKMKQGFETSKFYCMAFQYCPGGQLFYLLKKIRTMSQEHARFYFIQILLGIKYLHQKNILYRDLKPQNILIDYQGNLKIVDFGLSKKLIDNKQKTYSYCGSAQYMAPEMILRSGHNISIDYYSLGALLYELVTGLPPFYTKNQQQLQQSIITQQLSFPTHIMLSNEIKDFLCHLLNKDLKYRLGSYAGIKQIIFHPWVGKFNNQEYLNKNKNKKYIPFPPNLKQHNFDINQLGDDQQEFSHQIYQDFYCKKLINQLKYHVKAPKLENDHIYYQIIHKVIQQFQFNTTNSSRIKQKQKQKQSPYKSKSKFKKGNKYLYKYSNDIQYQEKQNNQNQNQSILSKTGKLSPDRKNNKAFGLKQYTRQQFTQKSAQKSVQKAQKAMKMYQKLFPYFSKNKAHKPQTLLIENRKTLPRANILKLKILANGMKDQSKQI